MPDLASDLRDYLDALVDPLDGATPPVLDLSREEPRARRRPLAVVAAGVAAALVIVAGYLVVDDDSTDRVTTADEPSVTTSIETTTSVAPRAEGVFPADGSSGPGWHVIDTGPVPAVESPTLAWTGTELFVGVGPTKVYSLDASTGTWTELPPLPDQMRTAESPPALIGTDVGVLAIEDSFRQAGSALWDADGSRWVDLGNVDVADNLAGVGTGMHARGPWGGGPAVVWTGEAALDLYHGAVWSPATRTWAPLPGPTDVTRFTGLLYTSPVWDGHEVVAVGWSSSGGVAWNASGDEYREVPGLPTELTDPTSNDDALAAVVDGQVLLLSGAQGAPLASFDSRTDTWAAVPSVGVGYGGEGCPTNVAATTAGPVAQPCYDEPLFVLMDGAWQVLDGVPDAASARWLEVDGGLLVWGVTTTDDGILRPRAALWIPSVGLSDTDRSPAP